MIAIVSYLHKGQWYGCADDASDALGTHGFGRQVLDNFEPNDDLCTSTAGFGRTKMGTSGSDGIFCGSGIYSNGGKRKA